LHKGESESRIDFEIEALRHAQSIERKGSWGELFNKMNRVRTMVAVIAMFGQQITGQAFASQYSVIFFQGEGFKGQSFLFNVLTNVAAFVCLIGEWLIIDKAGRRTMLMVGGSGMAIFMFVIGGVGVVADPTQPQKKALVCIYIVSPNPCWIANRKYQVASFILYTCAYNLSWAAW
jgi:SP family sugar:H+ symporter-like MFS transporter